MKKKRKTRMYRKVMLAFAVILLAVLFLIGVIINRFCMSFIKAQRIAYNTQVLGEVKYEFEELYMQMNQLLTSLCELSYTEPLDETVFQRIKAEVSFEDRLENVVYLNGFGSFCEGILSYDSEQEIYYVGTGSVSGEYTFASDALFNSLASDTLSCSIIGPMQEPYKAEHVKKSRVIGFVKKKAAAAQTGSLSPFVMVAVRFGMVENMLDKLFSSNTGFLLMDAEGNLLDSANIPDLHWSEETKEEIKNVILNDESSTQVVSRDGILLTSIRLEHYDWILSVANSEEILFRDINTLIRTVELLVGLVGGFGILCAGFISRKILFPIELLKELAEEMENDDAALSNPYTGDEADQVRALLNSMKKRIRDLSAKQYILEVREREAEIRMLQAQINPHFLYNTLDNIYCIAQIEEIEPIEALTRSLSEMLRYSLNSKSMFVTLREEMHHVQAYVNIINIRYEDRVRLLFRVEEELLDAAVVKLLLQPLAENACVHGILPKEGARGTIRIAAEKAGEDLMIYVEDDGIGITEELCGSMNFVMRQNVKSVRTPKTHGNGIALVNVNDRIRLLDGMEYGVRTERRKEGGTRIKVVQKYRTAGSEEK